MLISPTPEKTSNTFELPESDPSIPASRPSNPAVALNDPPLLFSRNKWMKLFNKGDFEALSADFIRVFHHFRQTNYMAVSAAKQATINDLVESFMFFFCHPDFKIPVKFLQSFMGLHPVICNVTAISDFRTTTPWVMRMMMSPESFLKVLILHNARSAAPLDRTVIFNINAFIASEWWSYYWSSAVSYCTKELHDRAIEHLHGLDDRFLIFGAESRGSYFPVTYVAPEMEHLAKERINTLASKAFENVNIRNKPNRKKIALISSRWFRSAVYTSLSPLIKSLRSSYDFTLIHYGMDESGLLDRDMFERIICIQLKKEQMNLEKLQDNEFCAVIYPDIGMHAESIFLSNIRLAPVQICMYGHPSSSWSRQIDYFIGGQKVELLENAERDYGERLVVIPGLGVYPVYPDKFTVPEITPAEEPMIINCGWTAQKVSYQLMAALQDILKKTTKKVLFRIFSGGAGSDNAFVPFVKDFQSLLGVGNVQAMFTLKQMDYLSILCQGTFSIDAYPFGGFNTIIDALYCKKPVVAWQGDRAFNRFTAATLEMIGMPELIAHSHEEYVEIVSRMINDDNFRKEEIAKVSAIDLKGAFAKEEKPGYFLKAIDYLVENHERLKAEGSRKPIIIE